MLSKEEVKHIVNFIQDAHPPMLHLDFIERNSKTDGYQIKCKYKGPTMKYGQQLFLHEMSLYIKTSDEWTRLYKILMDSNKKAS